jgi:chromosome segregation ATPase
VSRLTEVMCRTRLIFNWMKVLVGALAVMWVSMSACAELYKYTNEDGVTVLDSHVPARYVKNGYTILSLDGRVLEVVPRALTPKERRERDQKLARQQKEEEAKKKQEISDQNLLRLYSTPEDVVRARDTKLASIKGFIQTSNENITRLEEQKRNIEASLADVERAGGTIDKNQLDRIHSIENRVGQIKQEIKDKQNEMTELRSSFAADLKRVRELYGKD